MKKLSLCLIIIAVSIFVSALITAGDIKLKDEHLIQLETGAVKLGDIYREKRDITVTLTMDPDNKGGEYSVSGSSIEEVKLKLKEKLNSFIKLSGKKLSIETLVFNVPVSAQVTSSMTYNSQYQSVFTLNLTDKQKTIEPETIIYSAVEGMIDAQTAEILNGFRGASYISK